MCSPPDSAMMELKEPVKPRLSGAMQAETVLSVTHWTDRLFSFTTTRDPTLRFRSGQFTIIGLPDDGRPLLRAYSIASAVYADELEFFSIKVKNGPLTSRLQHIVAGSSLLVGHKPTGTLVTDNLLPGGCLYLLGTGTGVAPFASLIRDPEVYTQFGGVVLAHGCRAVGETAYSDQLVQGTMLDEFLGEEARTKLAYYPTVTREAFRHQGRITDLMMSGELCRNVGQPNLDPRRDRVMLCGSPAFIADMTGFLLSRGFDEGSSNRPAHFVVEKAFAAR